MPIYVKKIDLLFIALFIFFGIAFLGADSGFSIDYKYYIDYITQVNDLALDEILDMRIGPYIFLLGSTGIEIAFVFLLKVATLFSDSAEFVYAVIAMFSLAIKAFVCRRLGINWLIVLFILINSAILLEANALRSGLSLSIFILSIYKLTNRKFSLVTIFLWVLATLIHLQSIFFIIFFGFFYIFSLNHHSKVMTSFYFIGLMSVGLWLSIMLGLFLNSKLVFYINSDSLSGGFNVVSILSLIIVLFICWTLIKDSSFRKENAAIFSAICCTIPALSVYIFLTQVSVVGDRLWQWGLIILLIFIYPYFPRFKFIGVFMSPRNHIPKILMILVLSFLIFSTSIRYPLTNIFYPLIPYQDLTK